MSSVTYPTKLFLAFKSGGICAFKDCHANLTSDGVVSSPAVIGEAAHIYGENPGTEKRPASARYRNDMTEDERNHYNNLIYLCPTCHTRVDKQEADYSADFLLSLKLEHETWIAEQLDQGMSDISFAELTVAANALASGKHTSNEDYQVITPTEKIKKNALSESSKFYISIGLSQSPTVERFIANMAMNFDVQFPENLKNGFKTKYIELKKNLSGDALFIAMINFARAGKRDFKHQAAGLAILIHLFHICEVFEK